MTEEEKKNNFYKCEYESLRRKKNAEIERLHEQIAIMCRKTFDLLKGLGLSDNDIYAYYRGMK